jgi:hypothetical protein
MRNVQTVSLARLAMSAILAASFVLPLLDVSSATARTAGTTGTAGTAGTAGATGGGTGGGGPTIFRGPNPRLRTVQVRDRGSCYQSQPMFDRWGDYVGKQQMPDFCY